MGNSSSAKIMSSRKAYSTPHDLFLERIQELRSFFPDAFSEGKIDFDKFKALLGDIINTEKERYSFTWTGKGDAIKALQTPAMGTLRPAKNESVKFADTRNLFIEGDNLEVMKILYKSFFGRVKMIYIDPPYNTGKDFVYPDDFIAPVESYLKITGQTDEKGNMLTSNPETSGRYHSAWLSRMYPRLFLARQLLREDGIIFVSIDDHEVHNLRMLMNEIFGEENFVQHIIWHSKYTVAGDETKISNQHEHILCYAYNIDQCEIRPLPRTAEMDAAYRNPDNDPRGPWKATPLHAKSGNKNYTFTFKNGRTWTAPPGRWPRFSMETLRDLDNDNRIWFGTNGNNTPNVKTFLSEVKQGKTPGSLWHYEEVGHTHLANEQLAAILGKGIFDNPKPVGLIKRCLQISTRNDDIAMDFFAGSGTLAEAVLQLNMEDNGRRRFVCIQLPEPVAANTNAGREGYKTIAEIAKERIRRVITRLSKERLRGTLDNKDVTLDLGFKAFKLTKSNIMQWSPQEVKDTEAYSRQLELLNDPLVSNWKEEDVIYEIALREGYSLSLNIEKLQIKTANIYRISDIEKDQEFKICLDSSLTLDSLKGLGLSKEDLLVCRDIAIDDTIAANLALQCRLKTI